MASESPALILYDIPSSTTENCWSPNLWKARYALNFKGIPYKTIWVEMPDIANLYKTKGVQATSVTKDGEPSYTLPMLYDGFTHRFISDSKQIAKYLDATYPEAPSLFPYGTEALVMAFCAVLEPKLMRLYVFFPRSSLFLKPVSADYIRRTKEAEFGMKMEDMILKPGSADSIKGWAALRSELDEVDGWMKKEDRYMMKDTPSYADLYLAAHFVWARIIFGKHSQEWADITSWHDGRWGRLMKKMEEYEAVL